MRHSFDLPCRVRHTRRRGSIGLRISADEIRILAPKGTRDSTIDQVLRERQRWIEETVAAQQRKPVTRPGYIDGATLLVDGQPRQLIIEVGKRIACSGASGSLRLTLPTTDTPLEQRRQALIDWYQQQAQARWPDLLDAWARRIGVHPTSLKIRLYKSRWGACTARGQVSLNTLLLMAPPAVQEYVIIHELCHLVHLNHSAAYWALVARWCPDYQARRHWLKQHGTDLRFD